MNSVKSKIAAARKVYETYWESYQKGDIETFASTLDDTFEMIGTSETERCHTKAEGIEFFKSQMEEIVGKAEMMNRQIDVLPVEKLILVNEQCDIYVLSESVWTFYSKIRISTFLRETESGWKVTQQHGSLPDMRVQEGETLAIEKINKENLELRTAVKRRTAELENKNRELEIEAALERVRAVAMGMKKPEDMLEVCRIISDQLQLFGVAKIRNVQIAIIDENIGQYLCYQYFTPYEKTTVEKTEYLKSPVEDGMVKQMLASRDGYFIGSLSGKELEEFLSHRKEENHFPDPFLDKAKELAYCFLSIGEGGLGLTLYQPMAEDILSLFKRFHQVFSLAYQRFRDIQKAEAQAREAQIEVALERTRTQSMLMQHSDEIKSISNIFHEQLLLLDIPSEFAYVWLPDEANQSHQFWASWSEKNEGGTTLQSKQVTYPLDKTEPYTAACYAAWANPDVILEEFIPPSDIAGFFEVWQELLAGATKLKADFFPEGIYYSEAYMRYGCFGINIRRKLSEEEKNILKRFSIEFERAYTRFLDLKKAELQAREAQIEAALERVRAQTMAMHSSEDVGKCVVKMFGELTALGVDKGTRFGIGILNHENENNQLWTARKDGDEVNMHIGNIDMASHPLLKSARKAWKAQISFHKYVLEGEDLLNYYQMLNQAPDYKIQIPIEKLPKKEIQHCFIFEHGFFYAFTPREFQPELIHITKRFSSLFEQTYRRYLDLVRAEGQAREAEIELALERVRARTMAMHHTEELKDVIQVVFDQFVGLKINVEHAGFILDYKEQDDMHIWLADLQQGVPTEIIFPYFDSPHWISYLEAKAKEESFFANLLPFEVKNKFYRDLFERIPELTEEAKQTIFSKPALAISTVLLDNVGLYIEHYSETPFTPEENAILMRFGKVFQQTYTRFLDLKKAEAQAKEAQIEAALEKVRSRSLAMHSTNELGEVVTVIVEKLTELGVVLDANGVVLCTYFQDSKDVLHWIASPDFSFAGSYLLPYFDHSIFNDAWQSKENGELYFSKAYSIEDKNSFFEYAFEHSDYRHFPEDFKQWVFQNDKHILSFAWQKNSAILIPSHTGVVPSTDEVAILKRFAKVFEQAYTRFLDLQKAEAQAREAQIEAALERVRSRSMAMHKSEELAEVSLILFEQVEKLGIKTWSTGFNVWLEDETSYIDWVVNSASGKFLEPYKVDLTAHPSFMEISSAKKQGEDFFVHETEGETLEELYRLLSQMAKTQLEDIVKAGFQLPEHQINHYVFGSKVSLMFITFDPCPDAHDIFKRFGKVFEQTYTRFLDLQRAEAQARESQIQLALERVRARTMAMQHSDELMETSELMFEQIKNLGIELWSCGFSLWYDDDSYFLGYNPGPHGKLGNPLKIPLTEDIFFTTIRDAKRRGDDFLVFESEGESLVETYRYMDGLPVVGETMRGFVEAGFPLPTFQVTHCGFFSNGHLMFITKEPNSEAVDIFRRFTKVFNQTYTRFLDLQKAEEQVREAQIEAALERVRSRSLAMHKTAELQSVIHTVHQELLNLNISISGGSFIVINSEIDTELQCWGSGGTADTSDKVHIPRFEKPFYTHLLNRIKIGPGFFTEEYTREEKIEFFTFLFQHEPWSKLGEKEKKETLSAPGGYTRSCAVSKHTSIFIINHSGEKFSESENAILKRFGKVFEQAYTRFLDLQKAEAQAREARIEAALERVRSRTMAMQSSSELGNVAAELFAQMNQLVTNLWTCGFVLCEKDRDEDEWWLSMDGDFTRGFFLPNVGDYAHATLYEGWQKGEGLRAVQLDGETLQQHYDWLMEIPVSRAIFEEMDAAGLERPDWQKLHAAYFSKGYLVLITREPCGEEEIFKRFAQVFDQTYTRFLDLQKAEAQAREAQIEAALEKVRSASLAMHNSGQIREIVKVVFEKLKELKFAIDGGVFVGTMSNNSDHINFWIGDDHAEYPNSFKIPNYDAPTITDLWDAKKSGVEFISKTYSLIEKNIWFEYAFNHTDFKNALPEDFKKWILEQEYLTQSLAMHKNSLIGVHFHHAKTLTENEIDILKRFSRVFEQSYVRFLDLQKAEEQASEAGIQLALERVRARSLAMHRSEELADLSMELVKQVQTLGMESWFCAFNIYDDDPRGSVEWGSNGQGTFPQYRTPREGVFLRYFEAGQRGETLLINEIGEEACPAHYEYLCSLPGVGEQLLQMKAAGIPFPNSQIDHVAFFKYGYVLFITYEPAPESHDIFKRFAKVFEQSYTRFLDLQKAEAQAREAQIESALERVRSRTMAMHSSQDVDITVTTLFDELLKLGVDKSIRSGIGILDKSRRMEVWTASTNPSGQTALGKGILDMGIHQLLTEVQEAWEAKKPTNSYELVGDDLIKYFKAINDAPEYSLQVDLEKLPGKITHYDFFFPEGFLFAFSPTPLSAEISRVFMRFASVFGQTYRRYLDLQKAEAQVREAQIEAALERVRSRSLAMHSSDEFVDASDVMVNQLKELGIDTLRIGIGIINKEDDSTEIWSKSEIEGKVKNTIIGVVPRGLHPIFDQTVDAWKKNKSFYSSTRIGDEVKEYYQKLDAFLSYPERKEFNERETMTAFFFPHGSLNVISMDTLKEEDCAIMTRFAKVFGQIYQRFRDLQKAEAQAREAQIEAALERIRSRTMAMHKSDELLEIGVLLFREVSKLGINIFNCGYVLMNDEAKIGWNYGVNPGDGTIRPLPTGIPQTGTKVLESITESWKKQEPLLLELDPQETIEHQTYMAENMLNFSLTKVQLLALSPERLVIHTFNFKHGYLLLVDGAKLTADQQEMAIRFSKVFEQTYTRFLDLQKAEAQAREATKQASLDRVRGVIASMRSAADLDLITPLIFKELTILGVPFIRCGVFIIDEKQELVNAYLSSPEGNSLGVLKLPYHASELIQGTVDAWRKGEVYRQHWNKEDFVQWINIMMQQDQIQDSGTYQGTAAPPESLDLHFVPFAQGMLYVGAENPLDEKELKLVQALAKAFSIAYARYEDFVKLEQAKSEVEFAMSELKSTQSQLVQQEKLASLGQLTAGIAHEIKNPLNFVNNFSEVSMEMIEEILDSRCKTQDTRLKTEADEIEDEILEDIKGNLKKIHEHGSRANSIVTSMLQHSRGGSGKIDPTDLNALIKEYVNLSFHGMRAGKNPIDVEIDFDLDPKIKEVPLIKEDFIRVIINLCNNAFDAMRGKKYQVSGIKYQDEEGNDIEYLPKLNVTTSFEKGQVRIAIQDNGPGIPDEIKDKILQPFFTTKKGTEGTGLGLSITHDIIKAHGGELEIETSINKGTTLIIKLSK